MKVLGILCLAAWLLALPFPALATPPSPEVPLDTWVYSALDKITGTGLINSSLQGDRPFSRLEIARQVSEASKKVETTKVSPTILALLHRLEASFQEELTELQNQDGLHGKGYFKPVRDVALDYVYQNARSSSYPGTTASQVALNSNNFGIRYDNHHNGQLTLQGDTRLDGLFLLSWRPLFTAEDDGGGTIRLLQGKAAIGLGPFEVSAGRQSLWWGQGRHGSLILTNNARPLDMVRLTTPSPVHLPWIFSYLGPFRFDAFWSRLEDDRAVPHPYLAGLRLEIKPFPWLELGASRTAVFGGEGRPDVDFSDFFTILGGKNIGGKEDTSDQIAVLDGRFRLPFLGGIELYGEWGGEDEAAGTLANTAWLGGIFLAAPDPSGRLSLRFEFADLSRLDNNSAPWYRHGNYRSGYTYQGQILGHFVGGAGRDVFSELRAILSEDMALCLSFDFQDRGFDQPDHEKHYQPRVSVEWRFLPNLTLQANYSLDNIHNFNFNAGDNKTNHLAEIGVSASL